MKLNKLVSTVDLSHEEWLEYRRRGIGGSDAGAICGLSPYRTAVAIYLDKTGKNRIPLPDNEAMRQGRDLEQYVAERFSQDTGKKVRRLNAILYQEEHPYMQANVDRLIVGEEAGLECKTASAYSSDRWKDGRIPEEYELQCHHYMAVTGAKAWYIACVILGREFVWRRIDRDEEIMQMITEVEEAFWRNYVLADVMPPPDGSEAAEEIIKDCYRNSIPEKTIPLIGFDEKLKRVSDISELEEKLKQEKMQIEQEIKMYMMDAERAESGRYAVSWKTAISNRVDTKKLKAEQPQIYTAYTKESQSRRFTVREI